MAVPVAHDGQRQGRQNKWHVEGHEVIRRLTKELQEPVTALARHPAVNPSTGDPGAAVTRSPSLISPSMSMPEQSDPAQSATSRWGHGWIACDIDITGTSMGHVCATQGGACGTNTIQRVQCSMSLAQSAHITIP